MSRKFTCIVDKDDEGMAIRRMLKKHFDFSSRLFAKLRHQERVFLNGEVLKGWMRPKEGDVITCLLPDETSTFEPEDIPVIPVYEDDDLLIINKPAGYTVHPTKGHPAHTMANGVTKYMQDKGESFKIRFVNRLDMDTTGILVIGKNSHSQDAMVRDMKTDRIQKYYKAIVLGLIPDDEFTIDLPIGMEDPLKVGRTVVPEGEGRPSVTHVRVLGRYPGHFTASKSEMPDANREDPDSSEGVSYSEGFVRASEKADQNHACQDSEAVSTESAKSVIKESSESAAAESSESVAIESAGTVVTEYDGLTLVELRLETGRTHQIRVHMSHIGHPVLGDTLYGGTSELISRQALHAYKLIFHHPATNKKLTVTCQLPEDMQSILDNITPQRASK